MKRPASTFIPSPSPVILSAAKDLFHYRARIILLAGWMLGAGLSATAAQQPEVVHARLVARPAAASLDREFRAVLESNAGPTWIGYAMPLVAGDHHMCCYDCDLGPGHPGSVVPGCRLENEGSVNMQSGGLDRVELEGPKLMWVLFRVAQMRVVKIRVFSDDCRLDAGGLTVHWLTGVRPGESVGFLSGLVRGTDQGSEEDANESHVAKAAMAAIALTDDPSAVLVFDRFVGINSPPAVRAHASFWLGAARGLHGFELLKRLVQEDPSERVREQAVFGLSICKQAGSLQALIDVAHHGSARVRGQAIFWLAQKAGKKAAETITAAIEDDPEMEVKKRAVFALSQMPAEEGVPLLIKVARTNRNPEVRRQAIFWLGQSKDSRAWAFIEEVLTY